jgi:hypothetical protein
MDAKKKKKEIGQGSAQPVENPSVLGQMSHATRQQIRISWNKRCVYIQLPKREHPSHRPPQFAKYLRTCGKEGAVNIEKENKCMFPRSANNRKCNCRDDAVLNGEF